MSILFVGGGTLGSLNPLLAVAQEVRAQATEVAIHFWTRRNPLEHTVVQEYGFSVRSLPAGKFRRYFDVRNILDPFVILWAFCVSLLRFLRDRPKIVVSAGSFVAVPVTWAAWVLRIPTLVYQQDAALGLANRLMGMVATVRTATLPERAKLFSRPAETVGFAIRQDLLRGNAQKVFARYAVLAEQPTLLVIGGSSGALRLNDLIIAALPFLPTTVNVLHIVGQGKEKTVHHPYYVQIPFTSAALSDLYAAATLVVSRAGSNVLAEMVALGKPLIIVPLPETHQERNAESLRRQGAVVYSETDLRPETFAAAIYKLLQDGTQLAALAKAVQGVWPTNGAKNLATRILGFV